jgi:hypothetical protein
MPFEKPWRDYELGELVYGIASSDDNPRGEFIDKVVRGSNKSGNGIHTIDKYRVIGSELGRTGKIPDDNSKFQESLTSQGGKYSILEDDVMNTNASIRRKCKGGLYWQIFVENKNVHFVLDDIIMNAVVNKNYGKRPDQSADWGSGVTKNRGITGAELRWVYRNRIHKEVQDHIQFWIKFKQCEPPWISEPMLWSQYVPKREMNVHVQGDLDDLNEFDVKPKKGKGNGRGCVLF